MSWIGSKSGERKSKSVKLSRSVRWNKSVSRKRCESWWSKRFGKKFNVRFKRKSVSVSWLRSVNRKRW